MLHTNRIPIQDFQLNFGLPVSVYNYSQCPENLMHSMHSPKPWAAMQHAAGWCNRHFSPAACFPADIFMRLLGLVLIYQRPAVIFALSADHAWVLSVLLASNQTTVRLLVGKWEVCWGHMLINIDWYWPCKHQKALASHPLVPGDNRSP